MQISFRKISVMVSLMLTITGLLTAVMTLWNLPEGQVFLQAWIPTWVFTALVMAPLGMMMFWVVGSFYDRLFPQVANALRAVLQGVTMALIMESAMAASATYRLHGLQVGFGDIWLSNVLISLPVALILSAVMTVFLKPRLDAFLAS